MARRLPGRERDRKGTGGVQYLTELVGRVALVFAVLVAPLVWAAIKALKQAWDEHEVISVTTHERKKFLE